MPRPRYDQDDPDASWDYGEDEYRRRQEIRMDRKAAEREALLPSTGLKPDKAHHPNRQVHEGRFNA